MNTPSHFRFSISDLRLAESPVDRPHYFRIAPFMVLHTRIADLRRKHFHPQPQVEKSLLLFKSKIGNQKSKILRIR
jgi:hypothetical protein